MSLHNFFYPKNQVLGTTFIFTRMDPSQIKKILKDKADSRFDTPNLKEYIPDMFRFWLIRESSKLGALTIESIIYDNINKRWWGFEDKEEENVFLKPGTIMSQGIYIRNNADGTISEFCVMPMRVVLMNKGWARINTEEEYKINLEEMGGLMTELTADNAGGYYFNLMEVIENCLNYHPETRIDPYVYQQTNKDVYRRYRRDIVKENFTLK